MDILTAYDQSLIASIDEHNADDAERMLETAVALYKNRDGWLQPFERIAILKKLAQLMADQTEELALMIAKEGGKPLVDARVEAIRAVDGVEKSIEYLSHIKGEEIPMGLTAATAQRMAFTFREPIGVAVAVSAFNHPLNLIVHQVIPAVVVGCPVIVKPALTTPLSCLKLAELLKEAGLPEGWCQVCIGDNDVSSKLVTDARIAFFSFIGSAKVGWMLRSQLAPGVRCALEHGGAAPVIMDESADLEQAIPALAKGGFYHAGQVCVSVQRIYAPAAIATTVAQQLAKAAEDLTVGDPTSADTDVGPLILPREVDRVAQWVDEAVAAGAELLTGGKKLSDTTYAPTVLLNPPLDAKVSSMEIFGPVVCVYEYTDRQQAIELANSLPFSFQAAVFSNDFNIAMDSMKRLDAATVMINDHTAFRADWMPFAGHRQSGYGIGGIPYTMHDMTQEKLLVIKS